MIHIKHKVLRNATGFRAWLMRMFGCFHLRDDEGRGRCSMITSTVLQSVIAQLTTGIFYTGFLSAYGMNIVNIGIVTLAPYIANLTSIATPALLHKVKRRKIMLVACKFIYYTIGIAGFTLIPVLTLDSNTQVIALASVMIISNVFNGIAASGFASWQVVFLPERVRYEYFTASQFLATLIPGIMLLLSGAITDALAGSPSQLLILMALRWFAYIVALADLIVLALPREYEYKAEITEKIADIFKIPFKNKNWLLTMAAVFVWSFTSFAYSSALQVYLLQEVGVSYAYYNLINLAYFVSFILFSGFWRKMLTRYSWLSVYGVTLVIYSLAQIPYSFVNAANYLWLMTFVRLAQHVVGVGQNSCYLNLQYLCMPEEHHTCYTSFYQFTQNAGALTGLFAGTLYTARADGMLFNIFGYMMPDVPFMLLLVGTMQFALAFYVFFLSHMRSFKKFDNKQG